MAVSNPRGLSSSILRVSLWSFGVSALMGAAITPLLLVFVVGACHRPDGAEAFDFVLWPLKAVAKVLSPGGANLGILFVSGAIGYGILGGIIGLCLWAAWRVFDRRSANRTQ
jgi:hypothetical protein